MKKTSDLHRDEEVDQPERTVVLQVRRRRIQHAGGSCAEARLVHCPILRGMQSLEHCAACRRFQGMVIEKTSARIECHVPTSALGPGARQGMREILERASIVELPTSDLECLDPELSAAHAKRLMAAHQLLRAPVVDDRGVLLGMVSARTLQTVGLSVEVEDVMSDPRVKLLLTDSVFQAVQLIAGSGIDQLPVVTADDQLVGLVSALDLVSWLERATR